MMLLTVMAASACLTVAVLELLSLAIRTWRERKGSQRAACSGLAGDTFRQEHAFPREKTSLGGKPWQELLDPRAVDDVLLTDAWRIEGWTPELLARVAHDLTCDNPQGCDAPACKETQSGSAAPEPDWVKTSREWRELRADQRHTQWQELSARQRRAIIRRDRTPG